MTTTTTTTVQSQNHRKKRAVAARAPMTAKIATGLQIGRRLSKDRDTSSVDVGSRI